MWCGCKRVCVCVLTCFLFHCLLWPTEIYWYSTGNKSIKKEKWKMTTKKNKNLYIKREFPHCELRQCGKWNDCKGKGRYGKVRCGGATLLLLLGLPLLKHLSTKRSQFNNFHSAHRWLFIVLDFIYYLFVCLESARERGKMEESASVGELELERKRKA